MLPVSLEYDMTITDTQGRHIQNRSVKKILQRYI